MYNPFSLYLQYPLGFTMQCINQYNSAIMIIMYAMIITSSIYTTYLLLNLSNSENNYDTMKTIEHAPITIPLLLLCTHIVMAFFARKIYNGFKDGIRPVAPSLYVFIIGKLFMCARIKMAYSSNNYGRAIEFFIREELLLITIQVLTNIIIFPYLKLSYNCLDIYGQERVWKAVLALDGFKTLIIFGLWKNYESGLLSIVFNKIPGSTAQIFLFISSHVIMDVLQSISTIFSLYISKVCDSTEKENVIIENETKSCVLLLCHWMDRYFIENVFKYTSQRDEAINYCNELRGIKDKNLSPYGTV